MGTVGVDGFTGLPYSFCRIVPRKAVGSTVIVYIIPGLGEIMTIIAEFLTSSLKHKPGLHLQQYSVTRDVTGQPPRTPDHGNSVAPVSVSH